MLENRNLSISRKGTTAGVTSGSEATLHYTKAGWSLLARAQFLLPHMTPTLRDSAPKHVKVLPKHVGYALSGAIWSAQGIAGCQNSRASWNSNMPGSCHRRMARPLVKGLLAGAQAALPELLAGNCGVAVIKGIGAGLETFF